MTRYSQFGLGQVECYTAGSFIAVFQVAQQSDDRIQHGNRQHGEIQHAENATELFGVLHFVFQRQNLRTINHYNKDTKIQ